MTRPDDPRHPLHPRRLDRDADELEVDRDLLEEARRAAAWDAAGPEDPGHYMTDAEWSGVVEIAEHEQAHARAAAVERALPAGVTVLNWSAKFHGGAQTGTVQINHSAETPLAVGYARSIGSYFVNGPAAGTSAHHMVDPKTLVHLLPANVVGYHVGPNGNLGTIGWEQAGYAKFTRDQWTTDDGLAQIDVLAAAMAEEAAALKIPDRRLTNAQLAAWAANGRRLSDGGRSSHNAVRVVLAGTTHSDPDPNYPYDLLDPRITAYRNGEADDMFTDQDRADLKFIRTQIGGAVGAGQRDFAGTVEASLSGVQAAINLINKQTGVLASKITDAQTATLTAIAAVPSSHLTDAEQAELATQIGVFLASKGIGVDSQAVAAAVATDLAGRLAS